MHLKVIRHSSPNAAVPFDVQIVFDCEQEKLKQTQSEIRHLMGMLQQAEAMVTGAILAEVPMAAFVPGAAAEKIGVQMRPSTFTYEQK